MTVILAFILHDLPAIMEQLPVSRRAVVLTFKLGIVSNNNNFCFVTAFAFIKRDSQLPRVCHKQRKYAIK